MDASATEPTAPAGALIERSNRLGSDPRTTNCGGGNKSATGTTTDPVTCDEVEVMWIKGSGGDLGTLTPDGLSVLRLDRLRALERRHRHVEQRIDDGDDELHELLDHCCFGAPGAPPSIDTSMRGLLLNAINVIRGAEAVIVAPEGGAGETALPTPPGVRFNRVDVATSAPPDVAARVVFALVDGTLGRTGGRTIRVGDDEGAGR